GCDRFFPGFAVGSRGVAYVIGAAARGRLFEPRAAPERARDVDGQRALAAARDELELVAVDVRPQLDDLDPLRGYRPDVTAPPNAAGAVRRPKLPPQRVGERRQRGVARPLVPEHRPVRKDDGPDPVAAQRRRLDRR